MFPCFINKDELNPTQNSPISILMITAEELEGWIAQQFEVGNHWVRNTHFKASPASFCLLPDKTGNIKKVLLGVKNFEDFWSLGSLPFKLPEGVYFLEIAKSVSSAQFKQFILAWGLGAYQFTRYKTPSRNPARLVIPADIPGIIETQHLLQSIYLIRDLINTPAEDLGPAELSNAMNEVGAKFKAQVTQIVGEDLLKQNYPAIHIVGRGSSRAPRLLDLQWGDSQHPKLTLVGKGVCFDSGGLDLKNSAGMLLMKKDMGGAAHVLALAQLIMATQLPVHLRVLIPAVENLISGEAYRPGDVIKTRKGLTVEIGNTDAEGRVILADALAAGASDQPVLIIDFATLTGAARVALGTDIPAFFTNDDILAAKLHEHSQRLQDPLWRLPLYAPYNDLFSSSIADLNNAGASSYAGAITAALFLQNFIEPNISWVHIDLMAWNLSDRPGRPQGGEAMGLRAVFAYLQERFTAPSS